MLVGAGRAGLVLLRSASPPFITCTGRNSGPPKKGDDCRTAWQESECGGKKREAPDKRGVVVSWVRSSLAKPPRLSAYAAWQDPPAELVAKNDGAVISCIIPSGDGGLLPWLPSTHAHKHVCSGEGGSAGEKGRIRDDPRAGSVIGA